MQSGRMGTIESALTPAKVGPFPLGRLLYQTKCSQISSEPAGLPFPSATKNHRSVLMWKSGSYDHFGIHRGPASYRVLTPEMCA